MRPAGDGCHERGVSIAIRPCHLPVVRAGLACSARSRPAALPKR